MAPETEAELAAIAADRASGAARLAGRGLEILARACAGSRAASPEALLAEAAVLARRIDGLRPSMAAPGNWALAFCRDLRARLGARPPPDPRAAAEETARSLAEALRAHAGRIAEAAAPRLAGARALLTLSDSSTVEAVLLRAAPAACLLIVAESRPLLEGRALLGRLREAGRRVRLVTDAAAALSMREADLLLLGADTVCTDLAAVNKTGSHPAALAARALGVPCAVAADTFKVSGHLASGEVPLEEGPGGEVWEEAPGLCANVTFEAVPADLISFFLTEKGLLAHREMAGEAAGWAGLRRTFFAPA